MRINHNIAALNTYRQLSTNTNSTAKSLEKLSSGLRINRAGDDAAGLAISEKMRSQIRGLDQASRNANDGISLIQTAEGALNETHSILQRMKELAVQSSNDTNTQADRTEIQKEINQLTEEITRISKDTEFNTKKLLDGSMSNISATKTGSVAGEISSIAIAAGKTVADGDYTVTVSVAASGGSPRVAAEGNMTSPTQGLTANFSAGSIADGITTGSYVFTYAEATGQWQRDGSNINESDLAQYGVSNIDTSGVSTGATSTFTVEVTKQAVPAVSGSGEPKVDFSVSGGEAVKSDFDIRFSDDIEDGATFTVTVLNENASIFHIGANSKQNISLSISKMDAGSLSIDALDLTTQAGADAAITTIDAAISKVSSERAMLGAMQNRLEHTVNNLGTTSENLSASESRIRDVDMAREMMEFTKNNILSQASQAMLAQANMQPQSVLQLLQ